MSLELVEVTKHYRLPLRARDFCRRAVVTALDAISLALPEGRTVALIGESGCGKSTAAKMLLGLEAPTNGTAQFEGKDLTRLTRAERRRYRRAVQAVFQNPYASLNPRMRVEDIVTEPILATRLMPRQGARQRVKEVLNQVGLPEGSLRLYPHEFSGGQRQRIAIARALATRPRYLVLDEPVSALDVSIRAQIINLLKTLREEYGVGQLLISHDLGTSIHLSHTLVVLYAGRIIERIPAEHAAQGALHPYTKALLKAAEPQSFRGDIRAAALAGEVPDPADPPSGCRFHPRCPLRMARCESEEPALARTSEEHWVRCHLFPGDSRSVGPEGAIVDGRQSAPGSDRRPLGGSEA